MKSKVLLLWLKRINPLYRLLSVNVIREVCGFITFLLPLAVAYKARLIVFDIEQHDFRTVDIRHSPVLPHYDVTGECVCIYAQVSHAKVSQVVLCGGRSLVSDGQDSCINSTFLIEGDQISPLRKMLRGRYQHGLYYHEPSQRVLAFGGSCLPSVCSTSCEQYDISTDSWSALPSMNEEKDLVSTCGYREKVYICGQWAGSMEVFTLASQEFALVPLGLVHLWHTCTPVVWASKLLVLHDRNLRVLDLTTFALQSEVSFPETVFERLAVVVGNTLLNIDGKGGFALDLETLKIGSTFCFD